MFCFTSLACLTFRACLIRKQRDKLSGRKRVESAELVAEFCCGQAALAIQPAEKIRSGPLRFQGVAFQATGNEVALGIEAGLDAGHDVVEAHQSGREPAQTVKAQTTFARVDRLAQGPVLQKICLFEMKQGGQADATRLHRPRIAGISRGRSTSTTCPALLRSSRRIAPG